LPYAGHGIDFAQVRQDFQGIWALNESSHVPK
jgi:hypothetical protein